MSGRHRPENGADSDYILKRFIVTMGADDNEDRIKVRVAAAIGPRDAYTQARDTHPGWTPLGAEEVVLDYADAELQRAKEVGL